MLGTMPEMLRGILREVLGAQPDIEIVREARSDEELLIAVSTGAPDVVVVESVTGALSPAGNLVLRDRPSAHVLALSADGRMAAMYRLRAVRTLIHEVSAAGLREAIRSAVAAAAER